MPGASWVLEMARTLGAPRSFNDSGPGEQGTSWPALGRLPKRALAAYGRAGRPFATRTNCKRGNPGSSLDR